MANADPNLVSLAAYARLHGKKPQAATGWVKAGRIVLVGNLVDVAASNLLREKYRRRTPSTEPSTSTRKSLMVDGDDKPEKTVENLITTSGAEWSIDESKRVKESYLARLRQREFEERAGDLLPTTEVVKQIGLCVAIMRTRLLAIPAEQTMRIHRLKTPPEVYDALTDLITSAMEETCEALHKRGLGAGIPDADA